MFLLNRMIAVAVIGLSPMIASYSGVGAIGQSSAQSTASSKIPVAYDVVSIRPHKLDDGSMSTGNSNGTFQAKNLSLQDLVSDAYSIREGLISGLPGWGSSARWDVQAKIVDMSPEEWQKLHLTDAQRNQLLVSMLADRFHLTTHWETKQLPVYNLVVDKDGPKLAQNAATNAEDLKVVPGGGEMTQFIGVLAKAVFGKMPLTSLTRYLSDQLNREVIDQTGLGGNYSFVLKYTNREVAAETAGAAEDEADPPLAKAIQEQLGLKLIASKGSVKTLVVDHAEAPTEN